MILHRDTYCVGAILLLILPLSGANFPSTLQQVHLIFRHGDRSPTGTFPTDPYKEDAWPQGFGQLSQLGMQQEYQLGKLIRNSYSGFLNETYLTDEIYVRSTDKDRTLMSGYSTLAGLYPPKGFQVWNKNITWQPIPVHTVEYAEDNLLSLTDSICGKLSPMVDAVYQSPEVLNLEERQQEFFDMVRKNTGMPDATMYNIMEHVPNPLFCERMHNMTLPAWVTDDVYNKLQELKTYQSRLWFYTPEMQRLRGGVFLSELVNHTSDYISGVPGKKMYMYSAHDTTITGLLIPLGVWDGLLPPYSSYLAFELHKNNDGNYFVRLKYKNDTLTSPATDPMLLQLEGCGMDCEWSKFYDTIDPVVYRGDWFGECSMIAPTPQNHSDVGKAVVITIVVVVAVLVCVAIGLLIRKKCCKKNNYDRMYT